MKKTKIKETIIAKAGYNHLIRSVIDFARILRKVYFPIGVIHIHPGDHKVYLHKYNLAFKTKDLFLKSR